jgi:hypothetical protein
LFDLFDRAFDWQAAAHCQGRGVGWFTDRLA